MFNVQVFVCNTCLLQSYCYGLKFCSIVKTDVYKSLTVTWEFSIIVTNLSQGLAAAYTVNLEISCDFYNASEFLNWHL